MTERGLSRLLAVSLALNVFIIGAAVGAGVMWRWQAQDGGAGSQPRGLRFAAETLTPEQRRAFRQALAEARRQSAADAEQGRRGRTDIAQLIGTDPVDAAALARALEAVRRSDMALRARLEAAVVSFAASLSPEDRARLVDGLRGRTGMLRGVPED